MSIELTEIVARLVASSTWLDTAAQGLRNEWSPDEPPPTVLFGELGGTAANCSQMTDQELDAVAAIIEDVLLNGSAQAKDIVATGFLEAALAMPECVHSASRLLRRLGPESRQYCIEWDKFCGIVRPYFWGSEN